MFIKCKNLTEQVLIILHLNDQISLDMLTVIIDLIHTILTHVTIF